MSPHVYLCSVFEISAKDVCCCRVAVFQNVQGAVKCVGLLVSLVMSAMVAGNVTEGWAPLGGIGTTAGGGTTSVKAHTSYPSLCQAMVKYV